MERDQDVSLQASWKKLKFCFVFIEDKFPFCKCKMPKEKQGGLMSVEAVPHSGVGGGSNPTVTASVQQRDLTQRELRQFSVDQISFTSKHYTTTTAG